MNPRQRMIRFERLLHLDQQLLNRLAEHARDAAEKVAQATRRLDAARLQFESDFQFARRLSPNHSSSILAWSECSEAGLRKLSKIRVAAVEDHRQAQAAVQTQQTKVKRWEKLLETLGERKRIATASREANLADERYLQTRNRANH